MHPLERRCQCSESPLPLKLQVQHRAAERRLSALRVTRRPCRTGGMTVHVRLSADVSNHLSAEVSAEVGADISAHTGSVIAQVSADLGDDASADAGGNITHT